MLRASSDHRPDLAAGRHRDRVFAGLCCHCPLQGPGFPCCKPPLMILTVYCFLPAELGDRCQRVERESGTVKNCAPRKIGGVIVVRTVTAALCGQVGEWSPDKSAVHLRSNR